MSPFDNVRIARLGRIDFGADRRDRGSSCSAHGRCRLDAQRHFCGKRGHRSPARSARQVLAA